MRKLGTVLPIALLYGLPLVAQHQHQHPEPPPAEAQPEEHGEHAGKEGMDIAGLDAGHEIPGMLGPYKMSREASGTAWQPESTPHTGLHTMRGDWHLMAHGFLDVVYDDQDGPRGDEKLFSESMLMGMAVRPFGPGGIRRSGRLGLRAMISAEPWTIGDQGYPLLLQTGETADGRTPLVDRQHPHDLFMELAGTYSQDLGEDGSVFVYLGLPGEPALGPPGFLHRFSGMENPEAPLGHHWLDSSRSRTATGRPRSPGAATRTIPARPPTPSCWSPPPPWRPGIRSSAGSSGRRTTSCSAMEMRRERRITTPRFSTSARSAWATSTTQS